ncbi:hypothetical protein GCM10023187_52960 [Nibrella viscosa]|uniref:Lysozyme inhibitor LprI N-terminal domain-containing protein n=1 Tax=Nibrella viscosa TaxID=1084524 RepID=A0ABP8KYR9_9BACT
MKTLLLCLALLAVYPKAETRTTSRAELLNDEELYANVGWCVWHEGVRLYDDNEQKLTGTPGQLRPIEDLRADFLRHQRHNADAYGRIEGAGTEKLRRVINMIPQRTEAERQLWANFEWVAYHERKAGEMRGHLNAGNFAAIRYVYGATQGHNPNAKNLLAAISNDRLRYLVENL